LLFNVGLIEGIAVASDWPDHFTRTLTPHQSVKALAQLGMLPPVENLMSTGFFSFSAARSYTVAGSFVRYLYDEHGGAAPLARLYRTGGDFAEAYGRPFNDLAVSWLRMIQRTELPEGAAEVVQERFRHRSIFRRVCPHAIARKRERVRDLEGAGDDVGAIRVARSICTDAPGEPRHQIRLADLLSRAGQPDEAAEIYEQIASEEETVTSTLRAEALLRRIDQAGRGGDFETARALLDRAAALPVQDSLLRNIETRRWVAATTWPSGDKLREFFWSGAADTLALIDIAQAAIDAEPDSGLAHYLKGRHQIGSSELESAAAALSQALELGLPHPLLRREAARLLAETAFRTGDLAAVEAAAQILQEPGQPTVMQLYGADWLERVHFRNTGTLPPASDD
jgi:tetratricopeptide (TPR) repeat protein